MKDEILTGAIKDLQRLREEYLAKEQAILNPLTKEQRAEAGEPIKSVTKLDKFKANGNDYIIRSSLTVARFEEFEKLQARFGFGVDFAQLFANIRKAYDYLNASAPADAIVALHSIMEGIKFKVDDRENEILAVCSLFICRPDEDVRKYDPELNKDKINDWREEGIDMQDFFLLASNSVQGFTPAYKQASRDIFQKVANARKAATP